MDKYLLANSDGNVKPEGLSLITNVDQEGNDHSIFPKSFVMAQNYPNPFNPSTKIAFNVPSRLANTEVKLIVFDIQGNRVKELINESLPTGNYLIEWNGSNDANQKVSTGVYFYEIRVDTERFVGKMNLIK